MQHSALPNTLGLVFLCICLLVLNPSVSGLPVPDFVSSSVGVVNQTIASTNTSLAQMLQSIGDSLNWESSVYAALMFDKGNVTDLEAMIDDYAVQERWSDVLLWSSICRKLGIEREYAIKAALDGLPMVGSLPWTTKYLGSDWFNVEHKYALFGFWYAEKYGYRLDKWNKSKAYDFFKTAIDNTGTPVLFIDSLGTTYKISYGPRYYDEAACTIQCYLVFYELGIESGLDEALRWWNWANSNLWYQETHYKYGLAWPDYECEAGFFAKIISNLKYYYPSLGNWSRIASDLQNRFLIEKWSSRQWFSSSENTTTYVVVHHYPSNPQRRLQNTFGAWTAMQNMYDYFDSTSKDNMQAMLEGSNGAPPAWDLLTSSIGELYDNVTQMFRWMNNLEPSQDATAYALVLMFLMGIVPKTAVLAVPIEEYSYEYFYDLDPELYRVNLGNRTVRLAIRKAGDIEFIFGTTPVAYNFAENGVFELTFSSDWNAVQNSSKIGDLPGNRKFLQIQHDISLTGIFFSNREPFVNEPVAVQVDLVNNGIFPEEFYLLLKEEDSIVDNQTIELAPQQSLTLNFTWIPTVQGYRALVAFISNLEHDVYPQDNTITEYVYVRHWYYGTWGIFILTY